MWLLNGTYCHKLKWKSKIFDGNDNFNVVNLFQPTLIYLFWTSFEKINTVPCQNIIHVLYSGLISVFLEKKFDNSGLLQIVHGRNISVDWKKLKIWL